MAYRFDLRFVTRKESDLLPKPKCYVYLSHAPMDEARNYYVTYLVPPPQTGHAWLALLTRGIPNRMVDKKR